MLLSKPPPCTSTRYPDGTYLPEDQRFRPGQNVTGPCGYGCEISEDLGGPYVEIEEYTGDRSIVRRDKINRPRP